MRNSKLLKTLRSFRLLSPMVSEGTRDMMQVISREEWEDEHGPCSLLEMLQELHDRGFEVPYHVSYQ
jgi:hypothetical protein